DTAGTTSCRKTSSTAVRRGARSRSATSAAARSSNAVVPASIGPLLVPMMADARAGTLSRLTLRPAAPALLQGQGVGRRRHAGPQVQRGRGEEALVATVDSAVL